MKKIVAIIISLCLSVSLVIIVSADRKEAVRLPIVMYHHISSKATSLNDYVISPEEFRSDMEYLKEQGWQSISVCELLAWQRGEFDMPEKPMMISFDDGFLSVAEYAEPIMKEMGFCGVVALIGSVCDQYSESGEADPEWSDLSWEAAGEMAERGVLELQCHTWDLHSDKYPVGCGRKRGESIDAYRRRLSEDLSRFLSVSKKKGLDICYTIAYPYGAFDKSTTEIVKDMGFQAAFTCTEEINLLTGKREELYYLGRFNRPHGINSEKFFKKWENNY